MRVPAPVCLALAAAFLAAPAAALLPEQTPPPGWRMEWPDTDFSRSEVDFGGILSGGPPKDGIPAVDDPAHGPVSGEDRLAPREPVVSLEIGGAARAYPVRYLIWHEIVNDRLSGTPVAVTFCPLCNSALAFVGRLDGAELTFGVTGKLRHSDMIMYDRQSESWWQQFLGEGIVGEHAGRRLEALPVRLESWESFRERHPEGEVMQPPGLRRDYGRNPYVGYDGSSSPFLYQGEMPPPDIPPLARVVRVGDRAWPLARLRREGEIVEAGLRLTWGFGQASALDSGDIAEGREVGNVVVVDAGTGGPVVHEVVFAFVFQAFVPEGRWMRGS